MPVFTRNLRTRLSTIAWLSPASSKFATAWGTNGFLPFDPAVDDIAAEHGRG